MHKKYWLYGGLLMVAIAIALLLGYIFVWMPLYGDHMAILALFLPGFWLLSSISSLCFDFMGPPKNCPIGDTAFGIALVATSFIGWFLVGAVFGWIVGKIFNKSTS